MIDFKNDKQRNVFIHGFAYMYYKALMNEDTDEDKLTHCLLVLTDVLGNNVSNQIAKQVLKLMLKDARSYGLSNSDLVSTLMKLPAFQTMVAQQLNKFLEEENDDRTNFTT